MDIALITPLSPDEVIPDREADRLFMELVERGDKGEFTPSVVEMSVSEAADLAEILVENLYRITIFRD